MFRVYLLHMSTPQFVHRSPEELRVLKEYYEKIDFSYWDDEIKSLHPGGAGDLKEEGTANAIRLYSVYLQLIEIFYLNVFAITESRHLANLFLGNKELRSLIELAKGDPIFLDYFFEKWVFGIQEKDSIPNYQKKLLKYVAILKNATEDYLKDFDFLNAYKHGFRTHSSGAMTLSVSLDSNPGMGFQIVKCNSSVTFLSKENDVVFEKLISFNWHGVVERCEYILNMLQNAKQILNASGEKVDIEIFPSKQGSDFSLDKVAFRFKRPLYTIRRQDGS